LEQVREVFALPGSIHNPGSQGCHALIQQGAKLVVSTEDIMEELQGWLPQRAPEPEEVNAERVSELGPRESELLALLAYDPASIDLLHHRSNWPMAELVAVLLGLEMKGFVENRGGRYTRQI
jgi:DNA processing protein